MSTPKLAPADYLRTVPAKHTEDVATRRIREQAARVVAFVGHKQAADEIGVPESNLSHMLAGRGQRYLRVDWVPYLLTAAPDLEFARALVEPAGLVVEKAPQVTVEESLLGLLAVVTRNFPQLAEGLMAEAHREALAEASKRRGGGQ